MDFDTAEPDVIAAGIAEEIGREVNYRPSTRAAPSTP
jgi:hypothetical protein